jgi:hypothetical protein
MADPNNTVILRVQLDEGKTEEKLKQLVLDLEATRKAQASLTTERKAGTVTDEVFAQQSVKLANQLTLQRAEQRNLTKDLDLYRQAQNGQTESYAATQAALSLAIRQQQQLAGSANNSTEASQALTKQIESYRSTLAATDAQQGAFFRNIGNYPKSDNLDVLIQQLVHLQEVQKTVSAGTAEAAKVQDEIGYKFGQVNTKAAAEGKSLDDLKNKLSTYGEAIRPATAELVKLEKAQEEVAASAGKESERFTVVGFQIGQAKKAIAEVPKELAKVPTEADKASAALDKTSSALKEGVTKGLGLFGAQTDKVTGLLGKFKSGTDLVTSGLSTLKGGGETGALGIRTFGAALASVGIGVILLALSALIGYFTQTNEGSKLLKQGLAGLGAVVTTLSNLVFGAGKAMVEAFKNPKQALEDLLGFLKGQVVNRLAAFGVLLDGIRNRDFKKITDSVIQFNLGITNGTEKAQAYAAGIGKVVVSAAELEKQQQALKKSRAQLEQDEILEKGRVEELIRLSKDRTLSAADRLNKLREAGKLESELSAKSLKQLTAELDAIKQRNAAKGLTKTADEIQEERDKQKEYNNTVIERNNTLATIKARQSKFILEEQAALKAAQKTAAELAKQRAKDAVAAKQTENELALLEVVKGSAAELALKQRAIDLAADFELAGEKKTVEQVKLIRAKAEGDKLDLLRTYQEKELELAKKATAAQVAEEKRKYEEAERSLNDYLTDKRAAIEQEYAQGKISQNTYQLQLNALDKAGYDVALENARAYGQDRAKITKAQADLEIKEAQRVKDEKQKLEETKQKIQDAAFEAAAQTTDLIIELFGKESAAGQAALITKKTLALAEIGINLQKQLVANALAGTKISEEGAPFTIPLGVAYTIATDALAIAGAATATAKILGFRQGGIAVGPSHEDGGIPLYRRGRHTGIEIEGGEPVLTRRVSQNPLLLSLASAVNQLAGGRPLVPNSPVPRMALGGISVPLAQQQLRGDVAAPIDYTRLAKALTKVNIYTRTSDTKAALDRDAFTQAQSNS